VAEIRKYLGIEEKKSHAIPGYLMPCAPGLSQDVISAVNHMKGTSKKRSSPPDGAIVFRGALQVNGRQVAADKSTRQKTSSSGKNGRMGKG
jgi:hypothetical protein